MNDIVKYILAVVVGLLVGSFVNMGLVQLGSALFPLEGVDPNDFEALGDALTIGGPKYFIFPFLAHALGTLAGAVVAALIAPNRKMIYALVIGLFFLLGGIIMSTIIPAPIWFVLGDIVLAYIPMAWIGGKLGKRFSPQQVS